MSSKVQQTCLERSDSRVLRARSEPMDLGMLLAHRATSPPRSCRHGARYSEEPIAPEFRTKEQKQMSLSKAVTTSVFCLALMGVVYSPSAKADGWNRKTVITFSAPVEIPGVHLKGGGGGGGRAASVLIHTFTV